MFSQKKYSFQKETLKFVIVAPTFKNKLPGISIFISASLIAGFIVYLSLNMLHTTHSEVMLRSENRELRDRYEQLNRQLTELSGQISTVETKDDQVYRAIFGLSPLDSSIRKGGTGGNNRLQVSHSQYPGIIQKTSEKIDLLEARLNIEQNSLNKMLLLASKNTERMLHLPAIMPIANKDLRYTGSGFGMRQHPILHIRRMHKGIDFIAPNGTEVYATADGKVAGARGSKTFGNVIKIDHSYGYSTLYAHLKSFRIKPGDSVCRGEVIGWTGSTGLSAGSHLHYEVHYKGEEVDPVHYFFNDLDAGQYNEIIKQADKNDMSLD
jgi:murein DD-endopeptidase MepM/ murein hydrolase activator NlpD